MKKSTFAALAIAMALSSSAAFAADAVAPDQAPVAQVGGDHPAPPPGGEHGVHGKGGPGGPGQHDGRHKGGPRGERPDGFAKDLNLSPEQRGVMHQTMHEEMQDQKAIVGSYLGKLPKAEQDALAADLKASHDKQVAKFLAVLTPEQKAKAQEDFKKFEHGPGHDRGLPSPFGKKAPGDVPPPPPPAK